MTQVKLWQIISQTANAIIFSDADGNLQSLPTPGAGQVLIAGPDGAPVWADNTALQTAVQAQSSAANAVTTAKAYTDAQISALVGGAPLALDTLNELAQKLAGDETALNALIAQMETKASKTEVSAQIAQAKDEAATAATAFTNAAVSASAGNLTAHVQQVRNEVIIAAGYDASAKADAAQTAATTDANAYTDQRLTSVSNGITSDVDAKVDALRTSIPMEFQAEGTSAAVFLATSSTLDSTKATGEGLVVLQEIPELTGAPLADNDTSLNARLLFINGVAATDGWASFKDTNGQLRIQLTAQLAQHVFDGTENSLMLLAEYKSYSTISLIPIAA